MKLTGQDVKMIVTRGKNFYLKTQALFIYGKYQSSDDSIYNAPCALGALGVLYILPCCPVSFI